MEQNPKNKVYLSWEEVEGMISNLAEQIIKNHTITAIAGIPRGGLIPAVMLAHKLGLPMVSLDHINSGRYEQAYKEILIVDDICDTGVTLMPWVHEQWTTAVLIQKHENVAAVQATMHAQFKDYHELHDWIVFPWESKDADTIQDYLKPKTLAEIKKLATYVTGHEGRLPLEDQPAFDNAMQQAKEEGGEWRQIIDYGDGSISENNTHYRIDEFGCNCDLYRKNKPDA